MWLLNDRPMAMGRKEIVDIWMRWMESREPNIWINLGFLGGGGRGEGGGFCGL